jgi:hypothetical protein
MERFAADPTASIPEACDGGGETIAAYRFLGNESVDWREIMAPHWIAEMALEMPETRLVYVDREADLMPLMQRAQHLAHPADWLVRAAHNRCVPDGGKLFDVATSEAPMGELSFTMTSRHGVKGRLVRQQLWTRRVLGGN